MIPLKERCYRDNGIVISTKSIPFMAWYGPYETAVSFDCGESWHIAEGYDDFVAAKLGHIRYCNMPQEELERWTFIG